MSKLGPARDAAMDWKTELVRKINALKAHDFRDGKAEIVVRYLMPCDGHIAMFAPAFGCVNSHPVAWAGPGYLRLVTWGSVRTAEGMADGTLVFELSRELPLYDQIDFLSI